MQDLPTGINLGKAGIKVVVTENWVEMRNRKHSEGLVAENPVN